MSTKFIKLFLAALLIQAIILVIVSANQKDDNSQQTCSKDDELCKNAAKAKSETAAKEKAEPAAKASTSGAGADTSSKSESKSSKKTETKEKPKKSKAKKEEKEIADCPFCSYTRPLIKKIMAWIKDLLTDPLMIMAYDMFKDKIWELGHMTKDLVGFRLF